MAPELTVVVVVGALRERAGPCLASLRAQGLGERLEVLLVDLGPEGAGPIPGSEEPGVTVVRLSPATTFAAARAEVLHLVRAPVVAFAEEHTRLRPGWAEAVLETHRGPWAGVGWAIVEPHPERPKADVIGLMSYGLFEPPVRSGETVMLPGHNASFKTEVLRSYGGELRRLLACDLVLHTRMRRDGHRFALASEAVMEHVNEESYRSIGRGIHLFYRLYGPLRAAEEGWGPGRKLLYVAAAPAIPLYYLVSSLKRLRHERPERARLLLRSAAGVYAVQLCASVGQALGLLFGPGDAEERFTRYELTEPRGAEGLSARA